MRIGVNVGHFVGSPPADFASRIQALDAAGFASLWFAEAYGSDVFTPMAFCAALTSRVRLGAAVAQLPARTPTATAMAAMTLDHSRAGAWCSSTSVWRWRAKASCKSVVVPSLGGSGASADVPT